MIVNARRKLLEMLPLCVAEATVITINGFISDVNIRTDADAGKMSRYLYKTCV